MSNKVKFGLKNVHYSKITKDEDGVLTFAVPKRLPGAVSLTLEVQGEEVEFEADDAIYYTSYSSTGYKGNLEIANITDDFRKDILQEVEDETSHVLMEYANAETSPFALLYEVNGDEKATRRVLYNCSVSKPGENATTSGKTKTPQTDTMSITSVPLDDGLVRARTKDNTVDQVYNDWFKSVWRPTAASGASAVQANSPQEV